MNPPCNSRLPRTNRRPSRIDPRPALVPPPTGGCGCSRHVVSHAAANVTASIQNTAAMLTCDSNRPATAGPSANPSCIWICHNA